MNIDNPGFKAELKHTFSFFFIYFLLHWSALIQTFGNFFQFGKHFLVFYGENISKIPFLLGLFSKCSSANQLIIFFIFGKGRKVEIAISKKWRYLISLWCYTLN